ncbi:MAG: L,D-transpeptidase family protein [Patescibacteria group bacterium]
MYHKQLVTHVTTKLSAGVPKEQIQAELVLDGWSTDDIKEAFYYSAYPEKLNHFSLVRVLHSEVPTAVTVILITLIIITFVVLLPILKTTTLNYTLNLPPITKTDQVAFTYGEQPALSDPNFFRSVKQKFIDDGADFIEADLSAMTMRVYKKGQLEIEVPIDSKGREGSWWETPAGLYKVNNKEKAHLSGMAHVWMPWSMNFQGNFYIHGRTYYPDGTLTSREFTGGCVRLTTEDAEKVYNAVEVGTPILVFEHSFSPDNFTYKNEVGPALKAPVYLSADLLNNHIFTTKESTKPVPIASITKLMTALIATEYINLDNIATVPKEAIIYTSKARLKVGDRYSIYQLLFPLLMESSNEAAETIARYYGRTNFIKYMNNKAKSIGMLNTTFADPSGASAENVSTAEDLFMLAKYIYNNRSFVFNITSGKIKSSAYGSNVFNNLTNLNDFVDHEFFFGGKNGKTTAAAETNLSIFEFTTGNTKRPIVSIVLGSQNALNDSQILLDYTLNNFRR